MYDVRKLEAVVNQYTPVVENDAQTFTLQDDVLAVLLCRHVSQAASKKKPPQWYHDLVPESPLAPKAAVAPTEDVSILTYIRNPGRRATEMGNAKIYTWNWSARLITCSMRWVPPRPDTLVAR